MIISSLSFLKVSFTLVIVIGHLIWVMPQYGINAPFRCSDFGWLCDGFFILSGLFLKQSIEKSDRFYNYIKTKIIRLWPVLAFSVLCAYIVSKFKIITFCKYDNFLTLSFINRAFVELCTGNGCAWYVAVLFWCYILFFCVYKISGQEKFIYVTALISFVFYSILFKQTNIYNMVPYGEMFTFFMIRGIAGVSGGLLLSSVISLSKEANKESIVQKIFLGMIELIVLYSLVRFCFAKKLIFLFFVCFYISNFIFLYCRKASYLFFYQKKFGSIYPNIAIQFI